MKAMVERILADGDHIQELKLKYVEFWVRCPKTDTSFLDKDLANVGTVCVFEIDRLLDPTKKEPMILTPKRSGAQEVNVKKKDRGVQMKLLSETREVQTERRESEVLIDNAIERDISDGHSSINTSQPSRKTLANKSFSVQKMKSKEISMTSMRN